MQVILYFLASYLLGSIPTGTIAAFLMKKESVFKPGERTTKHAGDVFNILGFKIGILVTLVDVIKGYLAVSPLISWIIGAQGHLDWWVVSGGGLLVVVGHCNSALLGFRGGRGLATSFGVLFTLLPIPSLVTCIIWACLSFWGLSTRPGALSAAGAMPIFSIPWVLFIEKEKLFYLYVVAFLSLWTMWEHRQSLLGYLGLVKVADASAQENPKISSEQPDECDIKK